MNVYIGSTDTGRGNNSTCIASVVMHSSAATMCALVAVFGASFEGISQEWLDGQKPSCVFHQFDGWQCGRRNGMRLLGAQPHPLKKTLERVSMVPISGLVLLTMRFDTLGHNPGVPPSPPKGRARTPGRASSGGSGPLCVWAPSLSANVHHLRQNI